MVSVNNSSALSLGSNFSWTLLGSFAYGGCQWGIMVILAKIGTPEMVGQVALGFAICSPLFLFTNLHLRNTQATDARGDYDFGAYLGLRIVSTTLALLVTLVIIAGVRYRWETAMVILFIGLAKGFEGISDIVFGLLQKNERMDFVGKSMSLKGALSLAAVGISAYLTRDIIWTSISLSAAWGITLVVYDLPTGAFVLRDGVSGRRSIRPLWDLKRLAGLAWLTLPLGFAIMAGSLRSNIPRYFMERIMGERELGIFAAMAYMGIVGGRAVYALGESASPQLAKLYVSNEIKRFAWLMIKLVTACALIGFISTGIAALWGDPILRFFYGREYASHNGVFVLIMAACGIEYIGILLLQYCLTSMRILKVQAPIRFVGVVLTILTCVALLPSMGLLGAALAMAVGAASELVLTSGMIIRVVFSARESRRKVS
jgi:O-antigen/teichoic acid export membrane protein